MYSRSVRVTRTNYSCPDKLSPSLKAQQKKRNLGLEKQASIAKNMEEQERLNLQKSMEYKAWILSKTNTTETETEADIQWRNLKAIMTELDPLHTRINSWDEPASQDEHTRFLNLRMKFQEQVEALGLEPEYTFLCFYDIC